MSVSTSTIEGSVSVVAAAFGDACLVAVGDATAIFRTLLGVNDGNDYGRYFAGQNPLQPYATSSGSAPDMIAQGVALRQAARDAVTALIAASSGDPGSFADALRALVESVRQACATPRDAIRLLAGLSVFDLTLFSGTDAIGVQIASLAANAAVAMRRASAIALAEATADYVPVSQQDAQSVRDQVGDILDDIATEAADRFEDKSFAALSALRVAVVNDLTARGARLAPVVTRTLPMPLPADVVAEGLYQDGSRGDELVARNDPPHPGFLPRVIEALAA